MNSKAKCLNTCVNLSSLKPMQVRTENYRHLWNPVNPLMPVVTKGHTHLILQVCLSNMYDLMLLPDIQSLKLFYIDHNFVTLHRMPAYAVFFA